jgi:hypothetical protein
MTDALLANANPADAGDRSSAWSNCDETASQCRQMGKAADTVSPLRNPRGKTAGRGKLLKMPLAVRGCARAFIGLSERFGWSTPVLER